MEHAEPETSLMVRATATAEMSLENILQEGRTWRAAAGGRVAGRRVDGRAADLGEVGRSGGREGGDARAAGGGSGGGGLGGQRAGGRRRLRRRRRQGVPELRWRLRNRAARADNEWRCMGVDARCGVGASCLGRGTPRNAARRAARWAGAAAGSTAGARACPLFRSAGAPVARRRVRPAGWPWREKWCYGL